MFGAKQNIWNFLAFPGSILTKLKNDINLFFKYNYLATITSHTSKKYRQPRFGAEQNSWNFLTFPVQF